MTATIKTKQHTKRTRWTPIDVQAEANKFKTRLEFSNGSRGAYQFACRENILDQVCMHMQDKYTYWTYDASEQEALKYQTLADFQRGSACAYHYARKNNKLTQMCGHMKELVIHWSPHTAQQEALKFNSRRQFKYGSRAYEYARRTGILNQICSHMIRGVGGFHLDKPGWLYYIRFDVEGEDPLYKIGITNNEDVRIRVRNMSLGKIKSFTIIKKWYDELGKNIYDLEQSLHKKYSNWKYVGKSILGNGNTELFVLDVLQLDTNII